MCKRMHWSLRGTQWTAGALGGSGAVRGTALHKPTALLSPRTRRRACLVQSLCCICGQSTYVHFTSSIAIDVHSFSSDSPKCTGRSDLFSPLAQKGCTGGGWRARAGQGAAHCAGPHPLLPGMLFDNFCWSLFSLGLSTRRDSLKPHRTLDIPEGGNTPVPLAIVPALLLS